MGLSEARQAGIKVKNEPRSKLQNKAGKSGKSGGERKKSLAFQKYENRLSCHSPGLSPAGDSAGASCRCYEMLHLPLRDVSLHVAVGIEEKGIVVHHLLHDEH
ncbi:MAG: hypothetical protein ACXW3Z_06600 [Limisphaerales bacterium]